MHNDFSRPQVLECPGCGASLSLPQADSFECDYCGKRILVPPELRSRHDILGAEKPIIDSTRTVPAEIQALADLDTQTRKINPAKNRLILTIALSVTLIIFGGVLFLVALSPSQSSTRISGTSDVTLRTSPLPTMVQFARLVLAFGSKGNQPGQFDDARSIAVDPQGNIFVADYTSGRINKFDPQGNFLQLIQVESARNSFDVYIYGIATDSNGYLYVACDGNILKYDTTNGKLLLTIQSQWIDIYYGSVIVGPDGNLYATNGMAGADDILILNSEGELLARWTGTIKNVNHDDPSVELALSVDHSGMVYILSPIGNKVYGYNPDGSFNFSFGESGNKAGQLDLSIGMLAITEQDYLVISDVYRVDLFDANGNYHNRSFTIDYNIAGGSMFGMTIDNYGDLYYISSGGKVLKFEMNYP